MSHYRGYLMMDDHIVAPSIIEATEDVQAMLKARELLSTSQFLSIEVWHGYRLVGSLSAPAAPDEVAGPATPPIQQE
jgi:hypothetical protein